ncbi:MAG: AAA family ATPase, partial [Acidobacteriota bacterium]
MLLDLHIRNLAVVEEATIELGPGFNVLSGETGAGKSIVVDSLALLAGVRASQDQIRTGADTLAVTGVFRPEGDAWRAVLAAAGLDGDGGDDAERELVIRREISRNGRNRVFVDDQPTTLKLVGELAPHLIRIHGQREELGLVDPELQRTWLDRCGGAELAGAAVAVRAAHAERRRLADRL